jgi:1,4-alpha-glucan branching enzyme
MAIGDTMYFVLEGFTNARMVYLTGNFNAWNERELAMQKTPTGWQLPYVLAQGNYEYKYIVDGQWITDPSNPFTRGQGIYTNSVITIRPNQQFTLRATPMQGG